VSRKTISWFQWLWCFMATRNMTHKKYVNLTSNGYSKESEARKIITQILIIVYNATIYVHFNDTFALDLLKLFKIFKFY
jgi:hypothetical protein